MRPSAPSRLRQCRRRHDAMQITGKDFGPVFVKAKSGMIVAADRPVSYMRGWELRRAVALAERWHWQLSLSDDERAQLGQQQ